MFDTSRSVSSEIKRRAAKVCVAAAVITMAGATSDAFACWEQVAAKYSLTPQLLYAIAKYESGLRNDAINVNKNGSRDVCMMQVNSSHFGELGRYGITESMLKKDWCVCLDVGAWILSGMFQRYGNTWTAIGAYNAASADRRRKYAWGIYRELQKGYGSQ